MKTIKIIHEGDRFNACDERTRWTGTYDSLTPEKV